MSVRVRKYFVNKELPIFEIIDIKILLLLFYLTIDITL